MAEQPMLLSFIQLNTLSLCLLQRMSSNNDDKRKMEKDEESSTVRKRLRPTTTTVTMTPLTHRRRRRSPQRNQLDTSEEKLCARPACGILFSDDGTPHNVNRATCTRKSLALRRGEQR
jgi:hypothetical protein